MKTILYLVTAFALVTHLFAAGADRSRSREEREAAITDFDEHRSERHKWKKGQTLPESLAEAGLLPGVTLVWSDSYADGGTKGYLFKDSAGNFLAVCTGPGLQSKDHPQRIEAPVGSRLFIGGLHYTTGGVEMVPTGSAAEIWLRQLIQEKSGSNRQAAGVNVGP